MENPYAVLFEPVQIGPVTAPNRFYQVPHCNGFGHLFPRSVAAMRGIKAEGGWGVVCTEETEIHYTSDLSPAVEGRFWDASDIPAFSLTVDAIHEHGALAGIELTHSGHQAGNLYSRATSIDAGSLSVSGYFPAQTRMADKEDLRNIRRWHRQAAIHAKQAGFDIIYCYAAHELSLPMFLLLKRYNQRTDEYGGSLKNRVRFLRELLEDTHEAVGDTCAVALRLAVDELLGEDCCDAGGTA
jgi:dimethylamine/trimethylamine dehydrogenase